MNIKSLLEIKNERDNLNLLWSTVKGTAINFSTGRVIFDEDLENTIIKVFGKIVIFMDNDYFYLFQDDITLKSLYEIDEEQDCIVIDFNSMEEVQECKSFLKKPYLHPIYVIENTNEIREAYNFKNEANDVSSDIEFKRAYELVRILEGNIFEELVDGKVYFDIEEGLDKLEESRFLSNFGNSTLLSEIIDEEIDKKNFSKLELAEKIGVKYKTFINKLRINSISGEELIKLAIALDMDLNKLKKYFNDDEKIRLSDEAKHIVSLIDKGFIRGICPNWELSYNNKYLMPMNKEELKTVTSRISQGFCKGNNPVQWELIIEKNDDLD